MSDRVFGIISLFLIIFYAWGASLTQESFLPQPVGPKVMPYILAFLGSICSIYFILRPDDEPTWPSRYGWLEIISAILVMYAYAHLLSILGFVIASSFCASGLVSKLNDTEKQPDNAPLKRAIRNMIFIL